jgi:hypothetical protein
MHPYSHQQPPPDNDREGGHRGPLSRTWPQLFKKRRRYSPVRESAQQQAQQQAQQVQHQQQHAPPPQQQVQLPIHPVQPIKSPSIATQSIASPVSSMRSPSIAADTASTISSISYASSAPPKKIPISRRSSSIAPAGSNGKPHPFISRPPVTKSRDLADTPQEPAASQPRKPTCSPPSQITN